MLVHGIVVQLYNYNFNESLTTVKTVLAYNGFLIMFS